MPALASLVIRHFANGFLIGAATALAAMIARPGAIVSTLVDGSALGLMLVLFATGSSFGMVSLATGLWFSDGSSE